MINIKARQALIKHTDFLLGGSFRNRLKIQRTNTHRLLHCALTFSIASRQFLFTGVDGNFFLFLRNGDILLNIRVRLLISDIGFEPHIYTLLFGLDLSIPLSDSFGIIFFLLNKKISLSFVLVGEVNTDILAIGHRARIVLRTAIFLFLAEVKIKFFHHQRLLVIVWCCHYIFTVKINVIWILIINCRNWCFFYGTLSPGQGQDQGHCHLYV